MMDKKALRSHFRNVRDCVEQRAVKDCKIASLFLEKALPENTDTVLIYASIGSEVGTGKIIDSLLERNIKVALPKCGECGVMSFHLISSRDELKIGMYNIPEPDEEAESPVVSDRTVCVVPGLAFTKYGGRLGYGGGFYDRFTALYPQLYTIGLAYEELMTENLPLLPHDLNVNAVVTNERMVLCSAE